MEKKLCTDTETVMALFKSKHQNKAAALAAVQELVTWE